VCQIENITRKSTVLCILKGSVPDSSVLENFCRKELPEKPVIRISFFACKENVYMVYKYNMGFRKSLPKTTLNRIYLIDAEIAKSHGIIHE